MSEEPLYRPENCINYRLRRAARATARIYDDALRPIGLRNTQFTVLAAIQDRKDIAIGELADLLAVDATTLTRNLDLMAKKGWVSTAPAEDGRMRRSTLTDAGNAVLSDAWPHWRAAQDRVAATLENTAFAPLFGQLDRIEAA